MGLGVQAEYEKSSEISEGNEHTQEPKIQNREDSEIEDGAARPRRVDTCAA